MRPTSPLFDRRVAALGAVLAALVWGGLVHAGGSPAPGSGIPAAPTASDIAHVLNRLGYGPRPGDIERVQQMGLSAYIDQQLHPDRVSDDALETALSGFTTLKMSAAEVAEKYTIPAQKMRREVQQARGRAAQQAGAAPQTNAAQAATPDAPARAQLPPEVRMLQQQEQNVVNELMDQRLLRATTSERQLNEVLVDFWFNHFNVYLGKGQPERTYLTSYERDAIRPNVLGKFRDLLGATAHSPAMLFYLDNWESTDPHAPDRRLAQQEARLRLIMNPMQRMRAEMQLSQAREQQKKQPARGLNENYGRELMELHTLGVDGGYTQQDVIEVARAFTGWTIDRPQQGGGFKFDPVMHDPGEKHILGQTFPAGHGEDEGERVLDILAARPATAHHIAFELSQRFVSDKPPASLVDRAAQRFLDTKGDLREVVRTIVTSPEFFAADARRAQVKTPLEFIASAVRATGASVENAQQLAQILRNQLGMPLYGCVPPTGYNTTAATWMNTGALLNRMNVAMQLVSNQARGVRVDVASIAPNTDAATRDRLNQDLLAGTGSPATLATLAKAQAPQQLLALTLGAPEFQRR